jgi:1-acyl-sn-glycerol-3-phosphate acyltransferase
MAYGDFAWRTSRLWIAPLARILTRGRGYGLDRVPPSGGCVLAINHLAWVDIPLVGALSPRDINYVAKVELRHVPAVGRFLAWHGIIAIRRGESDRDAVRTMRQFAAAGRAIGVFVEGTRQKTGRPGHAQPGAAMVAIQEDVPVVPIAVYGSQFWKPGNFAPCSIAVGEPFRFEGLPKGGRGYKEASVEIERRLNILFDWLADVHARGRPRGETPPL